MKTGYWKMKRTVTAWFWIVGFCLLLSGPVRAGGDPPPLDAGLKAEQVYWVEGRIRKQAWMAVDEVALFKARGTVKRSVGSETIARHFPGATTLRENHFMTLLRLPEESEKETRDTRIQARDLDDGLRVRSVYYTSPDKNPNSRLVATGEMIVRYYPQMTDQGVSEFEKTYDLIRIQAISNIPQAYLYETSDPGSVIETSNMLRQTGLVQYAYPNWLRSRGTRAVPDDTLYNDQWHLNNTGLGGGIPGEDINVEDAWDHSQGDGVVIAVVDDGLQTDHEDLTDNIYPGQHKDWVDNDDDPYPGSSNDKHGTRVAGTVAGRWDNGKGISGVAPLARLIGHRLLGAETDFNESEALSRNYGIIDIYSNSWGPDDYGDHLEGPGTLTEDALEQGVMQGRGGLGCIYVWAGGNGETKGDNSNYDGYANSRYTIAVAASNDSGDQASYSEKGANILVNAPSGDSGHAYITTTDYASGTTNGYTSGFNGTSASAPQVAGVVALMLEAAESNQINLTLAGRSAHSGRNGLSE